MSQHYIVSHAHYTSDSFEPWEMHHQRKRALCRLRELASKLSTDEYVALYTANLKTNSLRKRVVLRGGNEC